MARAALTCSTQAGVAVIAAILATAMPASSQAATNSFVVPALPGGGFNVTMSSMLDRRFYTVVRQRYDFSCGSAALATLLHYHYGIPTDEDKTFQGMWDKGDQDAIRKSGFSLLDMKRYLGSQGLETQGFRVTLAQIEQTNIPGIALIVTQGYRHFVVIKGVGPNSVLVGDPSRGLMRIPRAEFEKLWDGLYFVITDARDVARSSFNRPGQWAGVTNIPLNGPLSRPVDMESLRITAPNRILGEYP